MAEFVRFTLDDGSEVLFESAESDPVALHGGPPAYSVWAVDTGLIPPLQDGRADVVIDVPSRRFTARVHRDRRRTAAIFYVNVLARDIPPSTLHGEVSVAVTYDGTINASLDETSAGLTIDSSHCRELIALGREVKRALDHSEHAVHPSASRLSAAYNTILHENRGSVGGQVHQRNVTVLADSKVDRSPCGSGTCARLAIFADQSRPASAGPTLRHASIDGSVFTGTVVITTTTTVGRPVVVP